MDSLNLVAIVRGLGGIVLIVLGILIIKLIPEATSTLNGEPSLRGWIIVISTVVVLIVGGGFLAFWKNHLWRVK